jgi:hypothetical protein
MVIASLKVWPSVVETLIKTLKVSICEDAVTQKINARSSGVNCVIGPIMETGELQVTCAVTRCSPCLSALS